MPEVVIRSIEAKDKAEWIKLFSTNPDSYLVFYKSTLSDEVINSTFERFLDPSCPVYCFVAVNSDDDSLIGFATYLTHHDTWAIKMRTYLNDLYVKPDSRLSGTGKKLINAVYDWSDANGGHMVYWLTQFENHRAQMLYTRVGKKDGFLVYRQPRPDEKPDFDSCI
ncbi:hypothetical protein CANARDRAFT_200177 [[Candida] arabinofermentans NRRL YB-2248]|uniref:N-acetyltransferase domain-containing protein n=1 Tax=[Candida] arabinofermentans NRRL YB-2248 TaxID=983967 RepID=A0A1E4SZ88_9ASCO|nr:hypothetical protein CANARDRAFT_200177 [[Candida] arabinofermentans NRRL YB-2248]